jgi:hypothetical protein
MVDEMWPVPPEEPTELEQVMHGLWWSAVIIGGLFFLWFLMR